MISINEIEKLEQRLMLYLEARSLTLADIQLANLYATAIIALKMNEKTGR